MTRFEVLTVDMVGFDAIGDGTFVVRLAFAEEKDRGVDLGTLAEIHPEAIYFEMDVMLRSDA